MFYEEEIKFRELLKYPPFCDIIKIEINDVSRNQTAKTAMQIYDSLNKQNVDGKMAIYKPMPCPIDKIKDRYRWRIIARCKFSNTVIDRVNNSIKDIKSTNARVMIDVNPNSMM